MNERLDTYINVEDVLSQVRTFGTEPPFDHAVLDGFFKDEVAYELATEFPDFESTVWHGYDSPLEIKRVCNNWNVFPSLTYRVFSFFNSQIFLDFLSVNLLSGMPLYADNGLNGGGWHIHKRGGKLNTHLDYSLHPKLNLQRKLNIIIYLNPEWREEWGGALGLWSNESADKPGTLVKKVWSKFNRAIIFDTTQNSWHGLPEPLECPEGQSRRSLAAYFLCEPPADVDKRGKALFAPAAGQENNESIQELIRKRADVLSASTTYKGL